MEAKKGECCVLGLKNGADLPQTADLQSSGVDTVLAHTLYSIIGALTLHRGGAAATQIVKERLLRQLGLKM